MTKSEMLALWGQGLSTKKLLPEEELILREIYQEMEKKRKIEVEKLIKEEKIVARKLKLNELNVETITRIDEKAEYYKDLVPHLLKELFGDYSPDMRACIASAIRRPHPALSDAWPILAGEFRRFCLQSVEGEDKEKRRENRALSNAFANLLYRSFKNKHMDQLVELLEDRKLGGDRAILLLALRRRRKNQAVREILDKLLCDNDLGPEIKSWK